ncbi:MAG TPA: glucose 1-dehydrogenase [Pirellulales bacterium]|nr:glucose 1-dehydrogenase [Pirellulales bacterium]
MQVDLKGQVAWVTGGGCGIGRAIAQALAANGAAVALLDINEANVMETAAELKAKGYRARGWKADVTDKERIAQVERESREEFGVCSILINNAGINTAKDRRPVHTYDESDWHKIIAVDLTGVFHCSRAVIPGMLERGGGRIVNIASVAGMVPLRLQSGFVAAKAGVINLSKSMACELGGQGILTNCVAPGSTLTDGTRSLFYGKDGAYSEKAASLIAHIPQGRPGEVEEIAAAVLFLVSPEASYVNGVLLPVDGGWTAGYTRDW